MSQFLLAPAAKSDIFEIWNYYPSEVGDVELADGMRDESRAQQTFEKEIAGSCYRPRLGTGVPFTGRLETPGACEFSAFGKAPPIRRRNVGPVLCKGVKFERPALGVTP